MDLGEVEGLSSNNRRARFYSLTKDGRRQLAHQTSQWRRLASAIGPVLGPETMEGKQCSVAARGITRTFPKNCEHTWNWRPTGCASRAAATKTHARWRTAT